MPSLEFKGKSFVYTHHPSVPFRELVVDAKKSLPANGQKPSVDDNRIIHGDYLHALKALLPVYAGKVDCIFIDPPYNTGNEGWCSNDNVRSPLMKEWHKKEANPVDKEDLERHDKWLCMMWPRLQLLRELLAEEGAIFITLDDNEVHRFRGIMDEIMGTENFVASIMWHKMDSPKNTAVQFSEDHDYPKPAEARHGASRRGSCYSGGHRDRISIEVRLKEACAASHRGAAPRRRPQRRVTGPGPAAGPDEDAAPEA